MDRKSVSAAVLIVAASAFYPPASSRNGTQASPSVVPIATAAQSAQLAMPSTEGPWKPICDHFARGLERGASRQSIKIDIDAKDGKKRLTAEIQGSGKSGKPKPLEQYCLQSPEAKRVTFRSMLVLAPDPELTHLSLDFDRTMESIVWAVTDGGVAFESYWFPWQQPPDKEETDPDKRKAIQEDQTDRLQKPGMLLFRGGDAKKPELLAVFVIGDRPNFGPGRVQFQAAIEGIKILQPDPKKRIPIVGPSFSGSIAPLSRLLEANPKQHFFVVTGRATNRGAIVEFPDNDTAPRSLCSTVENDETALNGFGKYARSSGLQLGGQVAILNEDETVYGSTQYSNRLGDTVQFRFPRGISRLRSTVEELPGLNSQPQGNTTGYQALILMVMAVYVYPFEDHLLLGAANVTMFVVLAVGMLIAFAQMDRDPVLSRLSATKPRLDMNFVWRVISYGSLPVLALLGSQCPTVGNFLFSWVQPALPSMK